jgi:homoserine kinase
MSDLLAEPYRTQLIPGFDAVKNAAMDAGAVGCGISGSGPSVFALCQGEGKTRQVADAISKAFNEIGLANEAFVSKVNAPGTRVTDFR